MTDNDNGRRGADHYLLSPKVSRRVNFGDRYTIMSQVVEKCGCICITEQVTRVGLKSVSRVDAFLQFTSGFDRCFSSGAKS